MTAEEVNALEEHTEKIYQDRRFAIEELCTITDKNGHEVPMKLWEPVQTDLLNLLTEAIETQRKTTILIPKYRQGGVSKLCCANNLVSARLYENQNSLYLIQSDDDTQPFFDDKVKEVDNNLPVEWSGKKNRDQSTALKYEDTNSSITISTAGATLNVTSKKGRAHRFNYVQVTEVSSIEHLNELRRGIRGSLPPNGTEVLEGTMDGPRNHYYQLCMEVYNEGKMLRKNLWRKGDTWMIFLPFWQHPEYVREKPLDFKLNPQDSFERKQWDAILSEGGDETHAVWYIMEYREVQRKDDNQDAQRTMLREYPITLMDGFLETGAMYFDMNVIRAQKAYIESRGVKFIEIGLMYQPEKEPIIMEPTRENRVFVWVPPEKGWKNRYCIFADCAEGNPNSDFDSFHVFDRVERETVAKVYGRLGGERLCEMMLAVGSWYGNAWLSLDLTGGYGNECKRLLLAAKYPNLFSFREVDSVFLEPQWFGVKWNETNKYSALAWLKTNWQRDNWRIWDLQAYKEAEYFGYPEDGKTPCAAEGFHDDIIMDLAGLAYFEPNLPTPVKDATAKPFTPADKIAKMKQKAMKRQRETAYSKGMGNYD